MAFHGFKKKILNRTRLETSSDLCISFPHLMVSPLKENRYVCICLMKRISCKSMCFWVFLLHKKMVGVETHRLELPSASGVSST